MSLLDHMRQELREKFESLKKRENPHYSPLYRKKDQKVLTARQFVKKQAAIHGGYAQTSFDTDENVFLPKEQVEKLSSLLTKYDYRVLEAEKITDEDLEGVEFDVEIFGARLKGERHPIPIKVTAEDLADWRIVHIHAPLRKVSSWYDRGWDHPYFESVVHKKAGERGR